jgi:Predicted transcriptional regulators
MRFNDTQPIFLQITDWVCERILARDWSPGDRIPSVRDLAVELEVNPNTVMRAYERLQQNEVIFNKRGIGYFLSEDAYPCVLAMRKAEFCEQELPLFFKKLSLLNISIKEIEEKYIQFQNSLTQSKNEEEQ